MWANPENNRMFQGNTADPPAMERASSHYKPIEPLDKT